MNERNFCLQPFPATDPLPCLQITGHAIRRSRILAIRYALVGPRAGLMLPSPVDRPARKHGLWNETCFECFLAVKGSPRYWEFNLSPAGHWNVYGFAAYRQGMQEETGFASLPFDVAAHPNVFALSLELDLERILPAGLALEVAISAVIQHADGKVTAWALTHGGPQADFHRRDAFVMEL
jgi:hypothetical protein